jgi:uncharacterized protein YjbJ (UPF0337 family)
MNEAQVSGNWKLFKGKLQEQWGKLTNDDIDVIEGKREQLLGRIEERQGVAREEADKQLSDWETRNPDFRW